MKNSSLPRMIYYTADLLRDTKKGRCLDVLFHCLQYSRFDLIFLVNYLRLFHRLIRSSSASWTVACSLFLRTTDIPASQDGQRIIT